MAPLGPDDVDSRSGKQRIHACNTSIAIYESTFDVFKHCGSVCPLTAFDARKISCRLIDCQRDRPGSIQRRPGCSRRIRPRRTQYAATLMRIDCPSVMIGPPRRLAAQRDASYGRAVTGNGCRGHAYTSPHRLSHWSAIVDVIQCFTGRCCSSSYIMWANWPTPAQLSDLDGNIGRELAQD